MVADYLPGDLGSLGVTASPLAQDLIILRGGLLRGHYDRPVSAGGY